MTDDELRGAILAARVDYAKAQARGVALAAMREHLRRELAVSDEAERAAMARMVRLIEQANERGVSFDVAPNWP